ncbi:hypothetical protein EAI_01147 [Harpegnathos saltator]|uniref:Uncharacterized protein n=1 Tax=Harpegnathos saltator TaxID=610380 RepID=E2C2V4_HARSA|nr:hypothetical protein EAI_01147 [Harpegnathos saltator]
MVVSTFVDLQGFMVGRRFVVKVSAILKNGTIFSHYVFTSPMPWHLLTRSDKSGATWLTANHHGLRREDGTVKYCRAEFDYYSCGGCMYGELEDDAPQFVYVKGHEKRELLLHFLDDNVRSSVIIKTMDTNYDDMPSLQKLNNTFRFFSQERGNNTFPKGVGTTISYNSIEDCLVGPFSKKIVAPNRKFLRLFGN